MRPGRAPPAAKMVPSQPPTTFRPFRTVPRHSPPPFDGELAYSGRVGDYMTSGIDLMRTVTRSTPVAEARRLLDLGDHIHFLPVLDPDGTVVDVITTTDLLHLSSEGMHPSSVTTVADLLLLGKRRPHHHLLTVTERAHLADAVAILQAANVHHLPVVDDKRRLVGVFSTSDLPI